MGLIGGLIRALAEPSNSHQVQQPTTYPNHTMEYIPTHAVNQGHYAPARSTCCSRKYERRAARRQMQMERAMIRAEYQAERYLQRAERRGGCCGRQRQGPLAAALIPVVQKAVAGLSSGSSRNVEGTQLRGGQENYAPESHGVTENTSSPSTPFREDAPPAYEDVPRKN